MSISFVLPEFTPFPIGGFKVVYGYANQLVRRGHRVTVVHPLTFEYPAVSSLADEHLINRHAVSSVCVPWFSLDERVSAIVVPDLREMFIPDSDVIFATAWQTAEWVGGYSRAKGAKLYLIHDYEHFMSADQRIRDRIARTFSLGMTNIITSPAGVDMLRMCHARFRCYLPNALDFEIFNLMTDICTRNGKVIGFPTRPERFKGTLDTLSALDEIHRETSLRTDVWSYGGTKPTYMPEWVTYYERPSDKTLSLLLNATSVFVVGSHYEGWGLPGCEAMACGAALVSTDNVGVRAYARHLRSALLSRPADPPQLAHNIRLLVTNASLRISIARLGHHGVQRFTWARAVDSMEHVITSASMVHRGERNDC